MALGQLQFWKLKGLDHVFLSQNFKIFQAVFTLHKSQFKVTLELLKMITFSVWLYLASFANAGCRKTRW